MISVVCNKEMLKDLVYVVKPKQGGEQKLLIKINELKKIKKKL